MPNALERLIRLNTVPAGPLDPDDVGVKDLGNNSDRKRLSKIFEIGERASLLASDRVIFADSMVVPASRHWLLPVASAWFTAPYVAGLKTVFTWSLCDGATQERADTLSPPPNLVRDTPGAYDTGARPFPIAGSQDSFFLSPDGSTLYGLSTIGGLHGHELFIRPRGFLRVTLTRNDALGPFMPPGTVLALGMQVLEEYDL